MKTERHGDVINKEAAIAILAAVADEPEVFLDLLGLNASLLFITGFFASLEDTYREKLND